MHPNVTLSARRLLSLIALLCSTAVFGQLDQASIDRQLIQTGLSLGIQPADLQDVVISDQVLTKHNGITHVYVRQRHAGIEVYNGTANLTFQNQQLIHIAERLERNLAARATATTPGLSAQQAISAAAEALKLRMSSATMVSQNAQEYVFSDPMLSQHDIPVKLMYLGGPEGELFLVWDLSIYTLDSHHYWSVRIDAGTGALLDQTDWVTSCDFPDHDHSQHAHEALPLMPQSITGIESTGSQYRVIPYFTESPNHGPDSLLTSPSDSIASPFGWHDTDGVAGAEFTITRGNNVYASEDRDADNVPGYSPDGDTSLIFDFPFNLNQAATGYEDASITNLFYMNNIMHDIFYLYGFDEAAGNFQANNYGRGGQDGDFVRADAQDGGGTNNANFSTPPDGTSGRMQMFLWNSGGGAQNLLTVNPPSTLAGSYQATEAAFGPGLPSTPLTADLVLVDDGTNPDPEDACDPIVNTAALSGKIAVIDRGNCTFVLKVEAAQNAGAVAVIIVNNTGGLFTMGGASNTITIPSIMITQADGNLIKAQLVAGDSISATLQAGTGNFPKDGDFDNGIIGHEYGHGISIRMTGGPSNSGCLSNAEQMGEGWSDYFGLILSFDTTMLDRGVGTFAAGQVTTGQGIRPAPYSPDFSINPFTYGSTNSTGQISQPHGIGFVWCTMLWDMTLALIEQYGYDDDLYYGTGGNNIALQLVMDGIKLQSCNPGFIDGRDAILLADQINNGGANQCLLWEVFANRGLGYSADQGSSNSRTDQVEAYDVPPTCLTPTAAPVANYSFSFSAGCTDKVTFTDQSTSTPQAWSWDFGDGATDSVQNPTHIYTANGSYLVTLIVTNTLGADTVFQTAVVTLPAAPVVTDTLVCLGQPGSVTINGSNQYTWYDTNGAILQVGPTLNLPTVTGDVDVLVDQTILPAIQKIGPLDGSFANGGYHNTGFTGTLNFEAFEEFTLLSAWIDAGSAGLRTIYLWDNSDGSGTVLDSAILNITTPGPQRVDLNLTVPEAGTYSVGGSSVDLFRNNQGANYPYVLGGLVSINSSSATTNPAGFYYYLYDWEVQGRGCKSERAPVTVKAADADFTVAQSQTTGEFEFTDQSTNATSWFWDFGDGNTSTLQNPTHGYSPQGSFQVTLTINGVCTKTEVVENIWATSLDQLLPGLTVQADPNPATDLVNISFSQPLPETVRLELYSPDGRQVRSQNLEAGERTVSWPLDDISSGLYLIQVRHSQGSYPIRLVVRN